MGAIIQGRQSFQIIPPEMGNYSKGGAKRGRLIEGQLLLKEIW